MRPVRKAYYRRLLGWARGVQSSISPMSGRGGHDGRATLHMRALGAEVRGGGRGRPAPGWGMDGSASALSTVSIACLIRHPGSAPSAHLVADSVQPRPNTVWKDRGSVLAHWPDLTASCAPPSHEEDDYERSARTGKLVRAEKPDSFRTGPLSRPRLQFGGTVVAAAAGGDGARGISPGTGRGIGSWGCSTWC